MAIREDFREKRATAGPAARPYACLVIVACLALGAFVTLGSCSTAVPARVAGAYGDWEATPAGLADPGTEGPYEARSFLYAGERNPRRPDYRAAAVRTEAVDLSAFFKPRDGLGEYVIRRGAYYDRINARHWGFGQDSAPLNGKVWYPAGAGPFPLVVCVHGNHDPYEASEFGYDYLGRHLATRGIVFASIDQGFLNGMTDGRENDARAALLLLHARELVRQGGDPASSLYGLIDASRMALMGHSRGGEAAVTAQVFNELGVYPENASVTFGPRLSVTAVISLAPIEGQYRPSQKPLMFSDADFLSLQGTADGDVDADFATRYVNRGSPAPGRFRSGFLILGANHARFNTVWTDSPGEVPAPIRLSPEDQRKACVVLSTAFLEASFGIEPRYREFLLDWRAGAAWLPKTAYVSRWRQGGDTPIADFEEDADPSTASASGWKAEAAGFGSWGEGMLPLDSGIWFFAPELSDRFRQTMNQGSCALFLRSPGTSARYAVWGPPIEADGIRLDLGWRGRAADATGPDLDLAVTLEGGDRIVRALADVFPIIASPGTFTPTKGVSRPYAMQTVRLDLPAGSRVVGLELMPGAQADGAGIEWYVDHIVAYSEGGLE